MKQLFFLLALLLFTSCYQVERNCVDYKTGTFEFTYTIDSVEKKSKFVRTEAYNIDFIDNKADTATIRWINDCEFIQKALNPKSKAEETAIHFKILATTKNSYTFEYSQAVIDAGKTKRVEKGTAYKIE